MAAVVVVAGSGPLVWGCFGRAKATLAAAGNSSPTPASCFGPIVACFGRCLAAVLARQCLNHFAAACFLALFLHSLQSKKAVRQELFFRASNTIKYLPCLLYFWWVFFCFILERFCGLLALIQRT